MWIPKGSQENHSETPRKTRLVDLAARAGVSAMTISRALRGVEGVSEAKRAEILTLANRLNYLPDMTARSMAAANSNLVGIALPTLFNDVFADVLSGMRGTFRSAGFATVIETTDYDRAREAEWVERLLSWRPAGIVLTGFDHDPTVRRMLVGADVPVVEIWDWRKEPIQLCVGIDHGVAGAALGAHVRALGYRRPAFIGAPEGRDSRAERRLEGLAQAFGGPIEVTRPTEANAFEAGLSGGTTLLRGPRPDVIFCLNDHIAFGALLAAAAAGLPVPLTTMRTPRREMGVLAAQALLARRHGVGQAAARCLACTIVPGGTTRRLG